jgi:hypothetical protein
MKFQHLRGDLLSSRIFSTFIPVIWFMLLCVSCQHRGADSQGRPRLFRREWEGSTASQAADTELGNLFLCDFENVLFFFETTHGEIRKTPEWKESAEFPPLSPRRAEASALQVAMKMRPDVQVWRFEEIRLLKTWEDRWMYLVRFQRGDVAVTGLPYFLDIPVLMNGRAIEGTRSRRKNQ